MSILFLTSFVPIFILIGTIIYWLRAKPKPIKSLCDLSNQSVQIKNSGGARRNAVLKNDEVISYFYDDVRTIYEAFQRGLHVSGDGPCLGYRKPNQPYQWLSYKQVSDRAEYLGSGLLHRGCNPCPEQYIGVFAQNRPEWIISELACYTYSMSVIPLYDTLGPDAIVYIINKAEISTVICDKMNKAIVLLENCEAKHTPLLTTIILMDPFDDTLKERGTNCKVEVLTLKEVEDLGRENLRKPIPPKPDDLSVVCFTSGTTGDPKGAMLTHGNVVANSAAFFAMMGSTFITNSDDISISYLPLAHMFERVVQTALYCTGSRVGFFQGDIRLLLDDMKTLQPTVFPVVPRLLTRVYDKVQTEFQSPFKRWLLNIAVSCKQAELSRGIIRNDSFWDKLIFNKIQATMGGRIRMMVTGAAPISSTVLTFLRATLGCPIFEAYGQTECTAGCTFSMAGDSAAGHVGPPLPCNIVKLVDVEDMNYFAAKGEGEVCLKGTNVFKGYLKDPEKTTEALDADGWLHTGDIGKWLPNGTLKIIDRKKNIFKLAQGEYIAPEKIENVYIQCGLVAQVFVAGDSLQSYLVGIVVPDPEVLPEFAASKGFKGSYEELCQIPEIKKAILDDMVKLGKKAGLKSFEQVKDLYLHTQMFTIENGLLTPTLKAKRSELSKFFKKQIDCLYGNTQA
ncbi:long-chain-fatty-acid--CoA ligase 5 [Pristis pectinata]|uniref:long-chain-fatty-acid--CoA ligase 5 n=1 Tax=Pristis pectinata TaxID=685728 RepID=UPI00223C9926|nr:long-chain-fatty-acid--CoA ligase 5 [Pristis pectinata]XP_051883171.1 long-chain-fatty-acid--CoA ligase 5 [Pristis pectinata]XP_051883172.1 long-chain-fatty-acid--CoA ligase 5 [Pristis pectinata]XP_051883173.1 long-chain-fatty-acid--CoA ligase 5 [Pristis pectinata]